MSMGPKEMEAIDPESEDEGDLDLETVASDALEVWFGIRLDRLVRPIRIVDVFGRSKEECAIILQDEGYYSLSDWGDGSELEPSSLADGSSASHQVTPGQLNIQAKSLNACVKRPLALEDGDAEDATDDTGSTAQLDVGSQDRSRKLRRQALFACPFRKRNPVRFNVCNPDTMTCAVKAFCSIADLKYVPT